MTKHPPAYAPCTLFLFYSSLCNLGKIRLLDVGSCFNPFLKFDEFLTVGIDIVPAVEVSTLFGPSPTDVSESLHEVFGCLVLVI